MARTLPLRVQPVDGEALDSWLEAIACRSRAPLTHVTEALGLSGPASRHSLVRPPWTIALADGEAEHLAMACEIDRDMLLGMTLARWHGRAVFIDWDRRRVDKRRLWGRACGSRYCPECLRESGGRWQLSWRLGFTFACTRHHLLLVDACPSCGAIPRSRNIYSGTVPIPGVCPSKSRNAPAVRCGYNLCEAAAPQLEADEPILLAQQQLTGLVEGEAPNTTDFAGVYGSTPIPIARVLADLRTLASRVLAFAQDDDLARWGASDLVRRCNSYREAPLTTYRGRRDAHTRGSWVAPTDAAATGLALTAALDSLNGAEPDTAIDRITWLTNRLQERGESAAHCDIDKWSAEISPDLVAIVLGAVHRSQGRRAVRLHYRTATGRPQRPAKGLDVPRARAQKMPSSLWDNWTLQLMPLDAGGNLRWATVQQALAVSVLQVGAWINLPQAQQLLGIDLGRKTLSRTLETLHAHEASVDILRAVTMLADVLDQSGSPIDYARRREVFGGRREFIDPEDWAGIRRQAGPVHDAQAYVQQANRWIYQRLTGNPIRQFPPPPCPDPLDTAKKYPQFIFELDPVEIEGLSRIGRQVLSTEGIVEPLNWEPDIPHSVAADVRLPGIVRESIHHSEVHDLILEGALSASAVARKLKTSPAHVRCILDRQPLDRRSPFAQRNEKWRQLYLGGLSATQISQVAGVSSTSILKELRRMGVEIRSRAPGRVYEHLVQEVIHRYSHLGESLQEIADTTGMCRATVRNILMREGVPRRPCGRRAQAT
ncbi:TniQ family protein [Streptomyces sp. NPDC003480]